MRKQPDRDDSQPLNTTGLMEEGVLPLIPDDEKSEKTDGLTERGQGGPVKNRDPREYWAWFSKDVSTPIISGKIIQIFGYKEFFATHVDVVASAKARGEVTYRRVVRNKRGEIIRKGGDPIIKEGVIEIRDHHSMVDETYYREAGIPEEVIQEAKQSRVLSTGAVDVLWQAKAKLLGNLSNEEPPKFSDYGKDRVDEFEQAKNDYYQPWTESAQFRMLFEGHVHAVLRATQKYDHLVRRQQEPYWLAKLDTAQEGFSALATALQRHAVEDTNGHFYKYLELNIQKHCQEQFARFNGPTSIPRRSMEEIQKAVAVRNSLSKHGREPTPAEIAEAMGVSEKSYREMMGADRLNFGISLNASASGEDDYSGESGDDEGLLVMETLADGAIPTPEEVMEAYDEQRHAEAISNHIDVALGELLTTKQRVAIELLYGLRETPEGEEAISTIADVARYLKISRPVASRRVKTALAKLETNPNVLAAVLLLDDPLFGEKKKLRVPTPAAKQGTNVTTVRIGDYARS